MLKPWEKPAHAALVDLVAAGMALNDEQALEHLENAQAHLNRAVDELLNAFGREQEQRS